MNDQVDSKHRQTKRLRWVAASTGLSTLSGLAITLIYLPAPLLLIVGAVIAGRSPRVGRWLMYAGAVLLTVFLLPTYASLLPDLFRHLSYDGLLPFLINAGWIGTLVLLPICDVMLVMDGYKSRPNRCNVGRTA